MRSKAQSRLTLDDESKTDLKSQVFFLHPPTKLATRIKSTLELSPNMDKNDQLETATVLGAREGQEAECLLSARCSRAWFVRLVVNVTAQFTHRAPPCAWFSYLSSTSWDPVPRASRCLLGLRSFSLSLNSINAAQCQCRVPARLRWSRMNASRRGDRFVIKLDFDVLALAFNWKHPFR